MIGQLIVANTLPLLGLLLVNIIQPQINSTATLNTPQDSSLATKQKIVWEVRKNETLSGIAGKYYGNPNYWVILAKDNSWIKDPNVLIAGWKLKLRTLPLLIDESEIISSGQNNVVPAPSSNFDDVYKDAGEKFGVPWQILYGLHLTETGLRDGTIYNRSGSGARGPMQFMPGTFQAYAVDGNGDGQTNIDDAKDAIYTAANYMAKHGSLENGLRSYGGNTSGTLNAARKRGLEI